MCSGALGPAAAALSRMFVLLQLCWPCLSSGLKNSNAALGSSRVKPCSCMTYLQDGSWNGVSLSQYIHPVSSAPLVS